MGVYYNKQRGKWHARLQRNTVLIDLGFYDDERDANLAIKLESQKEVPERPVKKVRRYSREWFEVMSRKQVKELTEKYK